MDRNQEDRRALIPQTLAGPPRQQLLRRKPTVAQRVYKQAPPAEETVVTSCNRCEKEFVQKKAPELNGARGRIGRVPRLYKLCEHCREMAKGRSRRWQMRTREHGGLCRRCGLGLGPDDEKFVLCGKCRKVFRERKLHRALEGKCVQCNEVLGEKNMTPEEIKEVEEEKEAGKVVQRRCKTCRLYKQGTNTKPFSTEFVQNMYK